MTDFQPYRKGTVLAPSGNCEHLHVVCNDPIFYPIDQCHCILVVNISSVKAGVPYDDACLLQVGDHGFIKHDSYVVYRRAAIWRVDNVIRKYQSGDITPHADMPDVTFQRILAGFDISEQVAIKHQRFRRNYC